MMKCLIPYPSEGLFNFQRLKYNYVYFSTPSVAHCPFPIMVAVFFEIKIFFFIFKICIFILKYRLPYFP